MSISERAKNICLTPQTEWPVIAAEPSSTTSLLTGYALPLAAIGAVAGFVGGSLVGTTLPFMGTYRVPIVAGATVALFTLVLTVVGVFLLAFLISALAPTFGGQPSSAQALKVAVYSYTPAWLAGVLRVVPGMGLLGILAACYGLYLLYLGLPRLMKCAQEKALGYTAVVVVCAIVISVVVSTTGALIVGAGVVGSNALSSVIERTTGTSSTPPAAATQADPNSPLGKLEQVAKKLDESNKKMEAAQQRGDAAGQVNAAMEGLGTLLGGGARVEPVGIDQLKPFVPETFAGLTRTSSNAEKSGIAGLMVSKAEATYGEGVKRVKLEVSDTGGVSGIVAFASWTNIQGEKEDDSGTERTQKVNGRLVHERQSKRGGPNEYGIVLGDRFVVAAEGTGVDLSDLKSAVSSLELGKLEAMKSAGIQK